MRREGGEGECEKQREAEWEAAVVFFAKATKGRRRRGGGRERRWCSVCERLVVAAKRSSATVGVGDSRSGRIDGWIDRWMDRRMVAGADKRQDN